MPCDVVEYTPGHVAFVCSRGRQPAARRCVVCKRPASQGPLFLCDWPLHGTKAGQTCDRPVCQEHASHRDPDLEYCPAHARLAETVPQGHDSVPAQDREEA
jgi:hypothetical protein